MKFSDKIKTDIKQRPTPLKGCAALPISSSVNVTHCQRINWLTSQILCLTQTLTLVENVSCVISDWKSLIADLWNLLRRPLPFVSKVHESLEVRLVRIILQIDVVGLQVWSPKPPQFVRLQRRELKAFSQNLSSLGFWETGSQATHRVCTVIGHCINAVSMQ